jgi:hypothetical protein
MAFSKSVWGRSVLAAGQEHDRDQHEGQHGPGDHDHAVSPVEVQDEDGQNGQRHAAGQDQDRETTIGLLAATTATTAD